MSNNARASLGIAVSTKKSFEANLVQKVPEVENRSERLGKIISNISLVSLVSAIRGLSEPSP